MNRNNIILSLTVSLALAGCSSYHAAYDQPNNSAYPNNPNNPTAALSSNYDNGTSQGSMQSGQSYQSDYQNSSTSGNNGSYAQNSNSPQDTGNGYTNPNSSRYPPNVARNLNNASNTGNPNYSPNGPTSPAGSSQDVNAASASPSDNSVAPLNSSATPQGGSQTAGVTNPTGMSSSVAPGQTNQMNNTNIATPVPAPDINRNANQTSEQSSDMNNPMAANNGAAADNGDKSGAGPQLGGLNEKQTAAQSLSGADQQFLKDAHGGNEFEISAGQKALDKAQDPNIKKIAQRMVDDHTKADTQAAAIANRNGDRNLGGLTADQLSQLAQLDKSTGGDFDAEYLRQQKTAHEQTIAEFKKEAQSADNPELRQWAAATIPTLQEHLDMINGVMNPQVGSER